MRLTESAIGKRKVVVWTIVAILILAVIFFGGVTPRRPRYIFINETQSHSHDLALKLSLKLAETRAGVENSLILLSKLPEGESIETSSDRYFKKYEIGKNRNGKGILYLFSEKENLFRIEVSYALEGVIPDSICRRLEEAAKTYMLSDTPVDFISELIITLNMRAAGEFASKENEDFSSPIWAKSEFFSGGGGANVRGYRRTIQEIEKAIERVPPLMDSFLPGTTVETTLNTYLESLKLGIGDPTLGLLTEGSRIFRMLSPRNREHQLRVSDYYQKAGAPRVFEKEKLAIAIFPPGVANLPIIFFRNREKRWLIDEPKSWAWFHRFENTTDFFPKYDDIPFMWALKKMNHPNANHPYFDQRVQTPKPYDTDLSLSGREKDLIDQKDYIRLGELYLFEMFWVTQAIESFKRASELEPRKTDLHWRLFDLYILNSEAEKALKELAVLKDLLPADDKVKTWYEHYSKVYGALADEF